MRNLRTIAIGTLIGALLAVAGCEIRPDGAYVEAGYVAAPDGYYYGPAYYNDGYYRGDYWYWHDRGHEYRERREMHDRRGHHRGGRDEHRGGDRR